MYTKLVNVFGGCTEWTGPLVNVAANMLDNSATSFRRRIYVKNVTSFRRLYDVTFLTYIRRLNDVAELSNNWPQRSPVSKHYGRRRLHIFHKLNLQDNLLYASNLLLTVVAVLSLFAFLF